MLRYECPVCKRSHVVWDARSRAFLCLSQSCSAFFKPSVKGMRYIEVCILISRGKIAIDPAWFVTDMNNENVGQSTTSLSSEATA